MCIENRDSLCTSEQSVYKIENSAHTPRTAHPEPVFKVGNLVTVNQDPYPALGNLFVQLWDGDDLVARVYADDEQTLHKRVATLNAIKAEQPEQEPVKVTDGMVYAFHNALSDGAIGEADFQEIKTGLTAALVDYAAPVRTKDLTNTEVFELIQRHRVGDMSAAHGLVRAVIAADREKNRG